METRFRLLHVRELTHAAITVVGFGMLGALVGASAKAMFFPVFILLVIGLVLGAATIVGVDLLLHATHLELRDRFGEDIIHRVVTRQFLLMIPFVVLGMVAQLFLGWDAAQSFAAGGLLVVGASLGNELTSLGGRWVKSLLLSAGSTFFFAALWILLTALVGGLWRG